MDDNSQLNSAYEDMPERRKLYTKYGIAAEAAQLLEAELGILLLQCRGLKEKWHIAPNVSARTAVDEIDGSTLGRLLTDLRRHIEIKGDLERRLKAGLRARNRLVHGFFARHNISIKSEDGRRKMIADLNGLHAAVFDAWQEASNLTSIMLSAIELLVRINREGGPAK